MAVHRIFFSVDLAHSSAFKQQAAVQAGPSAWMPLFLRFYQDFPRRFQAESGLKPRLWKSMGDELVFSWEGAEPQALGCLVRGFAKAVGDALYIEEAYPRLRLKGYAWLAEFPGLNAEIALGSDSDLRVEYLGLQMDAGFKLGERAMPGQVLLSRALALSVRECADGFSDKDVSNVWVEPATAGGEIGSLWALLGWGDEPHPGSKGMA